MVLLGILLIFIGGFSAGTSPWPMKTIKQFRLPEMIFISQFLGMFIIPWVIFFCICSVPMAYNIIGIRNILFANVFSLLFGICNILSLYCLANIGFVFTSVMCGTISLICGTLIPLIFKGSGVFKDAPDIFSIKGIIIIFALVILMIAIVFITLANHSKDKLLGKAGVYGHLTKKQNTFYILLCVLCGFMSPTLLLLNTYYGNIFKEAGISAGCPPELCSFGLWTFGMFGCIFINTLYAVYFIIKGKTFKTLFNIKELLACICSGAQYILYLVLFGFGSVMMGPLGGSVGNAIGQCVCTGGQQFVGFIFGEWKGVKGKPVKLLVLGLIFLFIGIIVISLNIY
ncbi:MAG: hypothetical protein IJS60_08185 [Abditibacteriota bacterium]|nr:hypothetical protein [Abditibacteriota bacterium]